MIFLAGAIRDQDDSLVTVPQAGAQPQATTVQFGLDCGPEGRTIHLDGYVNDKGRLARLEAPSFHADNFPDAFLAANRAAAFLLSRLAVRLNVPLAIVETETYELTTGICQLQITEPFHGATLPDHLDAEVPEEFAFYASLYREGLDSDSIGYQFLCFFKIIEGLNARRIRLAENLPRDGANPSRKRECLPAAGEECAAWLGELYGTKPESINLVLDQILPLEARGRKFLHVVDKYLRPIRHLIAHAVLDSGESTVMADEALDTNRVHHWLPVTICIARAMCYERTSRRRSGAGVTVEPCRHCDPSCEWHSRLA
jgi:hypothetical protein